MQQSGIFAIFVKVEPFHFAATAAPFGFHFRIQCADVVSARSEKGRCRFSVPPTLPTGAILPLWRRQIQLASKPLAAVQNRCAERQHLLSSSSLNLLSDKQALNASPTTSPTACLPPHLPATAAHPHSPAAVCSSPH
jgi:hypothetical protein